MNTKIKHIIIASVSVLLLGCMVLLSMHVVKTEVVINEPNTPLATMRTINSTVADQKIIPDKYNTGCILGEMIPVKEIGTYNGVQYTAYGTAGNGWLRLEFWKTNKNLGNEIIIENCDFSTNSLIITYTDKLTTTKTVHFKNCKFSSFTTSSNKNLVLDFKNCEFVHFAGSNVTCENCYFGGGSMGDAIDPGSNCKFLNCFVADLIHRSNVQDTNHIDGVQFFYGNEKVSFDNCRFEVPAMNYSVTSGYLNCPITFTLRKGSVSDISFNDCYVNGGLYYGVQFVNSPGYTFTNVTFNNVSVGQNSKYPCDDESGLGISDSISTTERLYVASVWKSAGKIHLSVTNDTNYVRTILIKTSNDEKTVTIPACPRAIDIATDSMDYKDFPFDIDVTIPDSDWVVCFDVTNGINEQIRFVNWSSEKVQIPEFAKKEVAVVEETATTKIAKQLVNDMSNSLLSSKSLTGISQSTSTTANITQKVATAVDDITTEAEKNVTIIAGSCGDSIVYVFDGSTLTLSGTGSTYNYNSSKTAPWYNYRKDIQNVVIESGITKIGTALFLNCSEITQVSIPEGVVTIDTNAFNKCKKISSISLPESVTTIGKYAFAGAPIKSISFGGTETEWNTISFGTNSGVVGSTITMEYKPEEIPAAVLFSGYCSDSVSWSLWDNGTIVLSGTGSTLSYNSAKPAPWNNYKNLITRVVVENGVVNIGDYLFSSLSNLEEIVIPDSVKKIGNNAFSKCKALTTVYLGSGITSIDKYAFNGDTKLSNITFAGSSTMWNNISFGKSSGIQNSTISFEK